MAILFKMEVTGGLLKDCFIEVVEWEPRKGSEE